MKIEQIDKKKTTKEMLPQVLERIFAICKSDPEFPLKNKLESVEYTIETLSKKIKNRNVLIEKGESLQKKLEKKIELIESSNLEKRERILESLGSEL